MSVVVKNEKPEPYVFKEGRNGKTLQIGEVTVLTEEEWDSVPFSQRGPGKLHPLWPDKVIGEITKTNFEYVVVGATYEVLYAGYADQAALDTDTTWTIKRFAYQTLGGANKVTQLQVLENVAWTDRATLPWT